MVQPLSQSGRKPLQVERVLANMVHGNMAEVNPELSVLDLVNEAGHYLCNFHDWVWLQRRETFLALRDTVTATGASWTEGTLTLTSVGSFADYDHLQGDRLEILAGTDVVLGFYTIVSKTDDDNIVLEESIQTSGGTASAIEFELTNTSVRLPDDFQEIIALDASDSLTISVHRTSLEELLRLRTNEIQVTSSYFYCAVNYAPVPVGGGAGEPVPILELWPAPNFNDADGFSLFYRAGWVNVTEDDDFILIPSWMHTPFIQLARAYSQGYEEDDVASLAERLAEWEIAPYTRRAIEKDGMQQASMGMLRGGSIENKTQGASFTITTPIAGPS